MRFYSTCEKLLLNFFDNLLIFKFSVEKFDALANIISGIYEHAAEYRIYINEIEVAYTERERDETDGEREGREIDKGVARHSFEEPPFFTYGA